MRVRLKKYKKKGRFYLVGGETIVETRARSAVTGRFVPKKYAKKNSKTTVLEQIRKKKR